MTDAQARLRLYLEQRRELGESEFVLDGMSVEEALRVLGGSPAAGGASRSGEAAGPAPAGNARTEERPPDSEKRRAAAAAAEGGDWREALRKVDAGEQKPTSKAPEVPRREASAPAAVAKGAVNKNAAVPVVGTPLVVGEGAARSQLTHLTTLAEIADAIAKCTSCTLFENAKNHVPGEGNPNAKFVVVGEAPGATEDELGRPFVGRSGDLLTKILEAVGLTRDEVFICNVLKHRPPANRNPTTAEIHACRPFLLRQLEVLQPRVILALGTFAAQTLLETDSPIGKLRGLEHRYHGIPLVATYHPAALLRNPNWKRPAWEDVQLARRILDRA